MRRKIINFSTRAQGIDVIGLPSRLALRKPGAPNCNETKYDQFMKQAEVFFFG
ncbi:hypothetical protein M413DRAFT_127172 [Hebeloma cylindrosporum]|uniref:Uncharacterized protein n=1 Tax=Hebeloma cylindrosporum TaxID=76867 RepID=A0A0C3BZV5_HEBCY|nr:hypothetical protein M413DRAFT_127172 [Hebeloma cylindrosporum h7]